MNPIVSQMVAEDRMATRQAEAAAYRRTMAAGTRRRMPWARQFAARAAARLAAALDPTMVDGVRPADV